MFNEKHLETIFGLFTFFYLIYYICSFIYLFINTLCCFHFITARAAFCFLRFVSFLFAAKEVIILLLLYIIKYDRNKSKCGSTLTTIFFKSVNWHLHSERLYQLKFKILGNFGSYFSVFNNVPIYYVAVWYKRRKRQCILGW